MKRWTSLLLALVLLPALGALLFAGSTGRASATLLNAHSGLTELADPTVEQLRAACAARQTAAARFTRKPSVQPPYDAGVLAPDFLQQELSSLNYLRYVAKLSPVALDETLTDYGQHAVVALAANGVLSHQPARPAGMEDDFYERAYNGAYNSNLSAASVSSYYTSYHWTEEQVEEYRLTQLPHRFLMFMIRDYDKNNFRELGHRRYLLSPYLLKCGFGMADTANGYVVYNAVTFSTTASTLAVEQNQDAEFDYVAWPPSGNCPNDLMEKTYPWSISLNELKYPVPSIPDEDGHPSYVGDRTGIVITVTRTEDGRVWTFDDQSPDGSDPSFNSKTFDQPYFYVDKNGDGFGPYRITPISPTSAIYEFEGNALIFRPDFEDSAPFEGVYRVEVTGLKDKDGAPVELCYEVNFFDIDACEHAWSEWTVTVNASCTRQGSMYRVCSNCSKTQTAAFSALGHDWGAWSDWSQNGEPTCTEGCTRTRVCGRCSSSEVERIDPLGHAWEDGAVLRQRTVEHDGARLRCCTRCFLEEEVVLPKLTDEDNPFRDVKKKYYYNAVLWAYYHIPQITGGTGEKQFSPNQTCTRAQVMTFLWKAYDAPEPASMDNPFTDVKPGKYYEKPVLWAFCHDPQITGGMSETAFGVNNPCTRAQVVTFLWKAAGAPEPESEENPFTDVKAGKYYYKAVLWAVENGVTSGMTDDTFGVNNACTRGQIVTFLYAAMED